MAHSLLIAAVEVWRVRSIGGLFLLTILACAPVTTLPDAGAPQPDASRPDAGAPDGGTASYLTQLRTPADYAQLTADDGEIKYLAPVEGGASTLTEACYFQDMHVFPWHLQFLRTFPGYQDLSLDAYASLVMRRQTRELWGGAVKTWPAVLHPLNNRAGIIGYFVYAESTPADRLTVADIATVHARLRSCIPFGADLLVFLPSDSAQEAMLRTAQPELTALGIASLFPQQLVGGIPFISYSEGEGYGFLRRIPRGQALGDHGPRDVIIVESAPNDISVVAGLISANPQNVHSHVNLRLQEKAIPNASVPAIYDNALVEQLDGSLVHLTVSGAQVSLEPARLEDAEQFWRERNPPVGTLPADLTAEAMLPFEELHHDDAIRIGVKAANLAEIFHALPAAHRQDGFAIPFAHQLAFMESNGLDDVVDALLADPRMRIDAAFKRTALQTLRNRMRTAPLSAAFTTALHAAIQEVFGDAGTTRFLRLRSSTNAEDLEDVTGAGLYDSRTGCLADDLDADSVGPSACLTQEHAAFLREELSHRRAELLAHPEREWLTDIVDDLEDDLTEEKPLQHAVRRVWASLWNERAFDEREYYGIDHRSVFMGVAVNPTFTMERANAVAVTNLSVDDGAPVYRLVSQVGALSVVRPEDPTAIAEVLTFRRQGVAMQDLRVLVPSSMTTPGQQVWPSDVLQALGTQLFALQDHFALHVHPDRQPLRLDVEIKWTHDGQVAFKQARPYVTRDP